jgi:hypothetical protein
MIGASSTSVVTHLDTFNEVYGFVAGEEVLRFYGYAAE